MFTGDFEESKGSEGTISEVSKEKFKDFLTFIYTGKDPTFPAEKDVLEMLELANRYQVDDLKLACERKLKMSLTSVSAPEIFQLAHDLECSIDMKKAAFNHIQT